MLRSTCLLLAVSSCLPLDGIIAAGVMHQQQRDRTEFSEAGRTLDNVLQNAMAEANGQNEPLSEPLALVADQEDDERIRNGLQRVDQPFYARWPWSWFWACGGGASVPLRWRFIRCDGKRGTSGRDDNKQSLGSSDDDLNKRQGLQTAKNVRFYSWGGKRGENEEAMDQETDQEELGRGSGANRLAPGGFVGEPYQENAKRAEPNQQVVLRVPFNAWGGKREEPMKKVRFHSWGGKRVPELMEAPSPRRAAPKVSFNAWGGKRSHRLPQPPPPQQQGLGQVYELTAAE